MRSSFALAAVVVLVGCSGDVGSSNGDAGNGSGSGSNLGSGEPPELAGMTNYHNIARAAVQTSPALPPLTWDPQLAAYAAAWAAKCQDTDAPIGLIDHDPNRSNVAGYQYIGENIYASGGATATAKGAVDSWVSEGQYYDASTGGCASGQICGHYTQVTWRTTTHVGCALHNCAGLMYPSSIVCDYGPGGNSGGKAY